MCTINHPFKLIKDEEYGQMGYLIEQKQWHVIKVSTENNSLYKYHKIKSGLNIK